MILWEYLSTAESITVFTWQNGWLHQALQSGSATLQISIELSVTYSSPSYFYGTKITQIHAVCIHMVQVADIGGYIVPSNNRITFFGLELPCYNHALN